MILKKRIFFLVTFAFIFMFLFISNNVIAQDYPKIIISEFQTGGINDTGVEDAQKEFIELYNTTDEPMSLAGIELQYLSEKHSGAETPTRIIAKFTEIDIIAPKSFYIVSSVGYIVNSQTYYQNYSSTGQLPKTSGSIRLYDTNLKAPIDIVGYGSATQNEIAPVKAPAVNESLQRCVQNNIAIDTNNNSKDFEIYSEKSPFAIVACVIEEPSQPIATEPPTLEDPQLPIDDSSPSEEAVAPLNTCSGIELSEVFPNPSGADAGKEFIELFNTTNNPINLVDCYLKLESGSKKYTFQDSILLPMQYYVIYDSVSSLTLPNSSGDTVSLYDANNTLLSSVSYLGGLDDDVSWAKVNNSWVATYTVTPNNINVAVIIKPCPSGQIRNIQTDRCVSEPTAVAQVSSPCPAGQERNPATGRCRSIVTNSNSLEACKPGQERNPLTNRCRSILSSSASALVVCKPGQVRNPETNRCKNIVTAVSTKPCPAGQERNPETNRCRKITNAENNLASKIGVTDIPNSKGDATGLVFAGIIAIFAVIYGLWAWRDDIRLSITSLISRIKN